MEFDPLSLFTPIPTKEYPFEVSDLLEGASNSFLTSASTSPSDFEMERIRTCEEVDADHLIPIHVHDLPLLQLKPPAEVILVFLKLLAPNEVYNFTTRSHSSEDKNVEEEPIDPSQVFIEKNVTVQELQNASPWLIKSNPRFDNDLKLASISLLGASLKRTHEREYNSWLTRIVSSDLAWVEDETLKADIVKQASLRISENCGRTAQPEIIRKIGIPNLPSIIPKDQEEYIRLKEPSLTSDNLGLKTWGSALILANKLVLGQSQKKYLYGLVLELGSGTGLVGMVSTMLGFDTLVTDLKEITPNLQDNVDLNGLSDIMKVEELDWSNPNSFLDKYGQIKFDTIILSDPIYSSMHPYWVVNMINLFLSDKSEARVLLQIPLRRNFEDERSLLWKLMSESNYLVEEENIEKGYDDFGENEFSFKKFVKKI